MKKSELRQLIAEYKKLKLQIQKKNSSQKRSQKKSNKLSIDIIMKQVKN